MANDQEISLNIRSLVLEALTLISSKDLQLLYQKNVPIADVSAELFCLWEDSYCPTGEIFKMGFSKEELGALKRFNYIFEKVCDNSPDELPYIDDVILTSYWRKYNSAALEALKAFSVDEVNSIMSSIKSNYSC